MKQQKPRLLLDLSEIQTPMDFAHTRFHRFTDKNNKSLVKHVHQPIYQRDLNRICTLSEGTMTSSMGDLYLKPSYETNRLSRSRGKRKRTLDSSSTT